MSRRNEPVTEDAPVGPRADTAHPLPQSGGSFTVTDGALVSDIVAPSPEKTPGPAAVKPVSKEA